MVESLKKNNLLNGKSVWISVGIVGLALTIRMIYLYEVSKSPTFLIPIIDSKAYDMIARELVEERNMSTHFFYQAFFYPFFLSIIYFLSNTSIVCAKVIQVSIGAIACVLTFFMGQKVFDRRTGILAGVIIALYGPLIAFEGELLATSLASFWTLVLLHLFLKADNKKGDFFYFVLGLCGGLSIITRATFIPFFVAASCWLVYALNRSSMVWWMIAGKYAFILAGFLFIIIPVSLQSLIITGSFSPLPASGALNFYMGNNPEISEIMAARPGGRWEELLSLPLRHGAKSMEDANKYYRQQVLNYALTEPVHFLFRLGRKTVHFFSSREIPSNFDLYLSRKYSKLFSILTWKIHGFGFPFGVLMPMAILGLVLSWRKIPMPIMLFLILYPSAIILVFVTARYRAPMVPVLAVLAAAGCLRMIEKIKEKQWRHTAAMAGIVVVIGLLSSIAGPFSAEKLNFEAEMYYSLGSEKAEKGNIEEGISDLKKAIQLDPEYTAAYHNLGGILFKAGRADEALTYFMKALEINSRLTSIHSNIGHTLLKLGRTDQAISHFMAEIQITPYDLNAYYSLGNVLMQRGEFEKAAGYLRKAFLLAKESGNYVLAAEIKNRLGEK